MSGQLAAILGLVSAVSSCAAGSDGYAVGEAVRISAASPGSEYYEARIGTAPDNARALIACAYTVRADGRIDNVFSVSADGGATWSETLTVSPAVDPSCRLGAGGVAVVSSIHDRADAEGSSTSFLAVHRSSDGGRTWHPLDEPPDSRTIDRAWVTLIPATDSSAEGVIVHGYLSYPRDDAGSALPAAFTVYSLDAEDRVPIRRVVRRGTTGAVPWYFLGNGVMTPDGTFVALGAELDKTASNMSFRTDASSAPQAPNGVLAVYRWRPGRNEIDMSPIVDVWYDWRVPQLSMPSLAVDRSGGAFDGRLYAAWPDARNEGHTQVFLATSDDLGRTWSDPRVLNGTDRRLQNGDRPNHFMPVVEVSAGGVVGVLWYDRDAHDDNLGYTPRFAASLDGGVSILPSVPLATPGNVAVEGELRVNGGDTAGLAVDADGVFHAAWIDNRSGSHQMWTTTVRVAATER